VPTAHISISGSTITSRFSLNKTRNDSNERPVLYTSLLLPSRISPSQNVRNAEVDRSSPTIVPSKSDTTRIGLRSVSSPSLSAVEEEETTTVVERREEEKEEEDFLLLLVLVKIDDDEDANW
jgi:hypothetical protein